MVALQEKPQEVIEVGTKKPQRPIKLKSVDEVRGYSPETDKECFEEIRQVLLKHNAQERYGVCLLHEHFSLANNEMLIETTDFATRTHTVKPYTPEEVADWQILDVSWKLDHDGIEAVGKCRH